MISVGEYLCLFFNEKSLRSTMAQDINEIFNSGNVLSHHSYLCNYPWALLLTDHLIKKPTLGRFSNYYLWYVCNLVIRLFKSFKTQKKVWFWISSVFCHRSSNPLIRENSPPGRIADNHLTLKSLSYFPHVLRGSYRSDHLSRQLIRINFQTVMARGKFLDATWPGNTSQIKQCQTFSQSQNQTQTPHWKTGYTYYQVGWWLNLDPNCDWLRTFLQRLAFRFHSGANILPDVNSGNEASLSLLPLQ